MEDSKDFYNWYKTKITENLQDPPEDAWQNISDELDVNDVWDRIAVELDSPAGWSASKVIYYSLPVLLLFLLCGGAYYYRPGHTPPAAAQTATAEDKEDKINTSQATELITKTPAASSGNEDEKSGESGEPGDEKDSGISHEESRRRSPAGNKIQRELLATSQNETVHTAGVMTESGDTHPSSQPLTLTHYSHYGIHPVVMPDSMLSVCPVLVTLNPDSYDGGTVTKLVKPMHVKTIEFGITASAKNTWLLNTMTLMGLEKHTLNTTLPDFGKDIGMVFSYNFSPLFSVQAEGMFVSEMGQRYKEYRNGKYVDSKIDLRYYTLNLLLKYNRNKRIHGHPLNGHSIIGGLFASRLNKATETISGEIFDSRDTYLGGNYGVILGYEYNRCVLPNLIITSGLRVNCGLPNIDAGVYSKTFTGSFDLNIAVRYRLAIKSRQKN